MKMIRRTSITSTKGVTLISLFCSTANLPPPSPAEFGGHGAYAPLSS